MNTTNTNKTVSLSTILREGRPVASRVLPDLTQAPAHDDIAAENARLRAKVAELEAAQSAKAKGNPMRLRVTEKGGLSVYGLGRFPVTLYKGQWQRLLDFAPEITAALPSLRDKED